MCIGLVEVLSKILSIRKFAVNWGNSVGYHLFLGVWDCWILHTWRLLGRLCILLCQQRFSSLSTSRFIQTRQMDSRVRNKTRACIIMIDSFMYRNFTDKDKVWTFGGGPRQCIGRFLSSMLLRVSYDVTYSLFNLVSRPIPSFACSIEKLGMGLGMRLLSVILLLILTHVSYRNVCSILWKATRGS